MFQLIIQMHRRGHESIFYLPDSKVQADNLAGSKIDLPPWSSVDERIVIDDGCGPLADGKLRLSVILPGMIQTEGRRVEPRAQASSLLGWGFFVFKNSNFIKERKYFLNVK